MNTLFEQKKRNFLADIHILALKHNRSYYTSLIPFIEKMTKDDEGLLDEYVAAFLQDKNMLMQSSCAFSGLREKVGHFIF